MTNHTALAALVASTTASLQGPARFGWQKVFISAVFAALPAGTFASLPAFKAWLVRAMPAGLVLLARADLVGAMDIGTVRASEISDRGAEFHFVLDQAARAPY